MASWAIDSEPIRARGIIVKYIVEEGEFLYKKAQKSSDALTTELIQALWRTESKFNYNTTPVTQDMFEVNRKRTFLCLDANVDTLLSRNK